MSTSTSPNSSPPEPAQIEGGLTASPDSISELFMRDPLEWSEADMKRMVAHYRKTRAELKADEAKGKKPTAAKIPKEDLSGISGDELLGKLGIDL